MPYQINWALGKPEAFRKESGRAAQFGVLIEYEPTEAEALKKLKP